MKRLVLVGVVVLVLLSATSASATPVFSVRMLPNSYVTFQVGSHMPKHHRFGYFGRATWRAIKDCKDFHIKASRSVRFHGHRLTNPHSRHAAVRGVCH